MRTGDRRLLSVGATNATRHDRDETMGGAGEDVVEERVGRDEWERTG